MPEADYQLTEAARGLLRGIGEVKLASVVVVRWNPRMRSAAGRAWLEEGRVDINPALREVGADEVDRTLRHELAHLVAQGRAGRRRILPHGKEWRRACGELGIPGERATHRLSLPGQERRRRHRYRCPRCGYVLERVREIKRPLACRQCCQVHSGGEFSAEFVFELIRELT